METGTSKDNWITRNWKWLVPAGCLGTIVFCFGCILLFFVTLFGILKSSDSYQQAVVRTQESAAAAEALGSPIEAGFWLTGSIEDNGRSGSANLSFPVSGPQGSGTVYVVAQKSAGEWEFMTLELAIKDSGERIDLLAER